MGDWARAERTLERQLAMAQEGYSARQSSNCRISLRHH